MEANTWQTRSWAACKDIADYFDRRCSGGVYVRMSLLPCWPTMNCGMPDTARTHLKFLSLSRQMMMMNFMEIGYPTSTSIVLASCYYAFWCKLLILIMFPSRYTPIEAITCGWWGEGWKPGRKGCGN